MQTNFLKLNENNTEFIILGLPQQLKKVGNITIKTGEGIIPNVPAVKNLGMFLDAELKHMIHTNKLKSSSFNTLHNISRVRCHLDQCCVGQYESMSIESHRYIYIGWFV